MRSLISAALFGLWVSLSSCSIGAPADTQPVPAHDSVLEHPVKAVLFVYPEYKDWYPQTYEYKYVLLVFRDEVLTVPGDEYRGDAGLQEVVSYLRKETDIPVQDVEVDLTHGENV